MHISKAHWGDLADGTPVHLYTLAHDNGLRVSISDFGATLVSWFAPDRDGRLADILFGHDSPAAYADNKAYMGATIGRWANRIAGARFMLDGVEYRVEANEGENLLHGGFKGFGQTLWQAQQEDDALTFTLDSPAGDAGFPGALNVRVTYVFDATGTLTLTYEAFSDAPTPVNLTSHAYFNLSGAGSGTGIRDHEVQIDADSFFAVDPTLIPTGEEHVADTPFDLRVAAQIGERLEVPNAQFAHCGGFDHCYVLHTAAPVTELPESRRVASVYHPASGRELIVSTTERGLQFYTGNSLAGVPAKNGTTCATHDALCLEAGGFPNQINMADAETVVLRPNERYKQVTQYALRTRNRTEAE
jgi:aldose 1-epimerase